MSFNVFAPGRATADVDSRSVYDPERSGSMSIDTSEDISQRFMSNWDFEGETLVLRITLSSRRDSAYTEIKIARGAEKLIELINSMNASEETFSFDEEEGEPYPEDGPYYSDPVSPAEAGYNAFVPDGVSETLTGADYELRTVNWMNTFTLDNLNSSAYTHIITPTEPEE